jgi:hypothetical protein
MIQTDVAQPDVAAPTEEEVKVPPDSGKGEEDPFALDESQFVSLAPEQRAALDPVLNGWKEKAKTYTKSQVESETKKYSEHVKRAQALESLTKDPEFVKWYQERIKPKTQSPQAVASPQEWAEAVNLMATGDPSSFMALQQKQFQTWAQPTVMGVQQQMQLLQAENEMTKLFSNHPDAKDLDQIGREADPTNPSLLELALYSVKDRQGGTMEQAYEVAKKVALAMENKGKRTAMGMVDDKKKSITEKGTSTSKDEGVIYVDTMAEAMEKNIEAAIEGRKVKYQVKK